MRPFYWPGDSTDPVHKKFILRLFVYMAIVLLFCAKAANLLAPHFMGMTVTSLSQGNKEDTIKYLIITAAMYMCGTSCDELRNVFYGYVSFLAPAFVQYRRRSNAPGLLPSHCQYTSTCIP